MQIVQVINLAGLAINDLDATYEHPEIVAHISSRENICPVLFVKAHVDVGKPIMSVRISLELAESVISRDILLQRITASVVGASALDVCLEIVAEELRCRRLG